MPSFEAKGEDRESVDLCDEPGRDEEPSLGSAADGPAGDGLNTQPSLPQPSPMGGGADRRRDGLILSGDSFPV